MALEPITGLLELVLGCSTFPATHRLVGLVVKPSASRAEDPGFESRLRQFFVFCFVFFWRGEGGGGGRSSHTSDLKIGTPVATLSVA